MSFIIYVGKCKKIVIHYELFSLFFSSRKLQISVRFFVLLFFVEILFFVTCLFTSLPKAWPSHGLDMKMQVVAAVAAASSNRQQCLASLSSRHPFSFLLFSLFPCVWVCVCVFMLDIIMASPLDKQSRTLSAIRKTITNTSPTAATSTRRVQSTVQHLPLCTHLSAALAKIKDGQPQAERWWRCRWWWWCPSDHA